jgi:uncharacterized protein (DUF362 family)
MGIIWNRRAWHLSDLHQCIADFATFKKPELTVVDAFNVMMRNGPRGGSAEDLANMKSLIIAVDPLAADVAGVKLFGIEPESVGYIKLAKQLNVGETDLSKLAIKKINI